MTTPITEPTNAPRNPHPTLNVTEAADYSGLSTSHIRRCLNDGRISSVRYGRYVRIPLAALNDYLRDGESIE